MKLPRDISAARLVLTLKSLGYRSALQRGNHIRLRDPSYPAYTVTFLNRGPLEMRTLRGVILAVAKSRFVPVESIIVLL